VKFPPLVIAGVVATTMSLAIAQAPPPLPPPPGMPEASPPTTRNPTPAAQGNPGAPTRPAASASPPAEPSVVIRTPTGAEALGSSEPPPSRWQPELDRLDADLRLRLLTANEPRVEWLAGEIETVDVESQVRHYTAARTSAPGERLYLASLGVACLQPVRPTLPPCDAVDRLADWARRDGDNGVPMLLLAGRARQRGEADLAASFIEQAALAPRFDDYWSQGAARWWAYLRGLDAGIDPAAKAKAAANYASIRDLAWAPPLRALCAEGQRTERMRIACASVGQALSARGATLALRLAGARVAELNGANDAARAAARAAHARVLTLTGRCAIATPDFTAAFESPRPADRAAAIEQFASWANAMAEFGEVSACERLLARK
jgi:hypothetical protein